jgi:hypothetical protein
MRAHFVSVVAMLLAGCTPGATEHAGTPSDFGAAIVASALASAMKECSLAGYEDLATCIEAPMAIAGGARRAALVAQDMSLTYAAACGESLGAQRCDDMLMSAYVSAQALR